MTRVTPELVVYVGHEAGRQLGSDHERAKLADHLKQLDLSPVRRDSKRGNADKYRFHDDGEARLSKRMKDSLLACQLELLEDISVHESALINELKPPLNLNQWSNPQNPLSRRGEKAVPRQCWPASEPELSVSGSSEPEVLTVPMPPST